MVEEHIKLSKSLQTEFDEWVENGCNKAKELIKAESDVSNVKEQ